LDWKLGPNWLKLNRAEKIFTTTVENENINVEEEHETQTLTTNRAITEHRP